MTLSLAQLDEIERLLSDRLQEHCPDLIALASLAREALGRKGGWVMVPTVPTTGLLMSMAIRSDHGLAIPGYYDQSFFGVERTTHAERLRSTLSQMRQLHEEVVGTGFYKPENDAEYAAMTTPPES